MGTFSKSIGGEGGYVAGETRLINYLRNVARGFIFSTSLSPVTMAANLAGIEVLEKEISRVTKLQYNVKYFCRQLGKYGINVKSETAIIPVIIGDEENALTVSTIFMRMDILYQRYVIQLLLKEQQGLESRLCPAIQKQN